MTDSTAATATTTAQTGHGDRRGGRRRDVVAALAVTTTIGYGVLYYAFSVLLGPMSSDLRISTATAAGAMTTAVLVSGAMSIPVGRWLDARGGHALMTLGSLLGAAAVLAWSQVHTTAQLYAVFVAIGVASAMVLYEPAFAVIIAVTEPGRRTKALLGVTLVAGFASSIFIPLTAQLVDAYGWRRAVAILGVAVAAIAVPLHAVALRRTGPRAAAEPSRGHPNRAPSRVLRDPGFWLLAAAFVLHSAALAVIAIHLVLYLISLGHLPALAAGLAGLLGLLSVTGRVVTTLSLRWLPMATIAAAILTLQGAAIAVLPIVGRTAGCDSATVPIAERVAATIWPSDRRRKVLISVSEADRSAARREGAVCRCPGQRSLTGYLRRLSHRSLTAWSERCVGVPLCRGATRGTAHSSHPMMGRSSGKR